MKHFFRQILLLTTVTFLFNNCRRTKDDLVGTYVSRNNINTIDTLILFADGKYKNDMYRAQDKSLIYDNTGVWTFSDGYITLDNFYSDEDDIHSKEEGSFENVLMTKKLPIETKAGKIIIHHVAMYDNIYFEKLN
jgi:hypothetical protein